MVSSFVLKTYYYDQKGDMFLFLYMISQVSEVLFMETGTGGRQVGSSFCTWHVWYTSFCSLFWLNFHQNFSVLQHFYVIMTVHVLRVPLLSSVVAVIHSWLWGKCWASVSRRNFAALFDCYWVLSIYFFYSVYIYIFLVR